MSETFTLAGDLEFEHVGTMVCGERLLICDVEYLPPRFAGTTQGKVSLDVDVEIVPGTWQVLLAFDPDAEADEDGDGPSPRFVLLTHDAELETPAPLDQAEAVALLRVDSGRLTALDAELRDDPDIQTAVLEAPREQVPCMLTPLAEPGDTRAQEPRGTLIDLDVAGVFELYAPPGRPRTALFLAIA